MAIEDGARPCGTSGMSAAVHVVDEGQACREAAALLRSAGFAAETHGSVTAFLQALDALPPDRAGCVLAGIGMPGLDGLELLRQVRRRGVAWPVVVMAAHGDVPAAVQAMKAGAFDCLEKPTDSATLLTAVAAALGASAAGPPPEDGGLPPLAINAVARVAALSPREREVLNLALDGKPAKVIARELGISPRTVEVHRTRFMARLEVRSLAEAARLAVWAELAGFRADASYAV